MSSGIPAKQRFKKQYNAHLRDIDHNIQTPPGSGSGLGCIFSEIIKIYNCETHTQKKWH